MEMEKQFLDCLKCKDTSEQFKKLDELGILEELIPDIKDIKKTGKCKYHVVDAFHHSLYTLAKFEEILKDDSFLAPHLKEQVWEYLNSKDDSGFPILDVLRLGVFLHDIGKPAAETVDSEGRHHFRGHEIKGEEIVARLADRLNFSEATKEKLCKYVRYHMALLISYKFNDLEKKTLWMIFDKLGDDTIGILLLGYCDIVVTRQLLNPNEHCEVTKTYMEFMLVNYLYRYKMKAEE